VPPAGSMKPPAHRRSFSNLREPVYRAGVSSDLKSFAPELVCARVAGELHALVARLHFCSVLPQLSCRGAHKVPQKQAGSQTR
jgi:hypothetical protein